METEINWEQKAMDAIDAIAAKLGSGVDHFYPILVRQQVVDGCAMLVVPTLLTIVVVIAVSCCYKKATVSEENFNFQGVVLIISAVLSLIALITLGDAISEDVVTKIFNPEYHALKDIMDMIK